MSLIKDGKVYRTIEEQVAWLTKIKYNSYQKEDIDKIVSTLNQEIDTKADKQEVNQTVSTLNQEIDTKADKQEVNQTVTTLNQKIDTKADKQEVNQTVTTLNQKIDTKQDKLNFDSTPTVNSINPVTSGGVYNAIKTEKQEVNQTVATLNQKINTKQDKLNFDSTPTQNSSNPVTSGGVYNAIETEKQEVNQTVETLNQKINTKQDKLTFDTTPTVNSTNPVTSGGVYNAIEEIKNNSSDIPSVSQLAEWNESNLTSSLLNCSGILVKSTFIIGRKGDVMSIAGRFIIYIESRTADNPGIKIDLPTSWNIPSVTRSVSYGDAFIIADSPYDNSTPLGIRPYFIDLDANSRSLNIRLTETYTNVAGRFYSFQVPLTYIKL